MKLYALVKEWHDECGTIDVAYPFFYPYNYGKDICMGVDIGGHCNGPLNGKYPNKETHTTILDIFLFI